MSEASAIPSPVEQQKPAAKSGTALDWGIGPVLDVQAEILADAEATMTDWLRRRREAVLDTRQLMSRLCVGGDLSEAFQAQRDWVSRSFQRLAEDTDACQGVARLLIDRASGWFPQASGSPDTPSSQSAGPQAVRPLRMANK